MGSTAALNDYQYLVQSRKTMFDHLVWWSVALKAAREMKGAKSAQAARSIRKPRFRSAKPS
jgi:hypothetical protein